VNLTFNRATGNRPAYDPVQVEEFVEDARRAYDAPAGMPATLTAMQIRQVSFALKRGGYDAAQVDAGLERLEIAFATAEREAAIARDGWESWSSRGVAAAEDLRDRLLREPENRFRKAKGAGYKRSEVDAFSERVLDYLATGVGLTLPDVRRVTFTAARGGYDEAQVDYALDVLIDIMLAKGH
jgi:DivIVA domain-containing protein